MRSILILKLKHRFRSLKNNCLKKIIQSSNAHILHLEGLEMSNMDLRRMKTRTGKILGEGLTTP